LAFPQQFSASAIEGVEFAVVKGGSGEKETAAITNTLCQTLLFDPDLRSDKIMDFHGLFLSLL
jgi:hypothetical protein